MDDHLHEYSRISPYACQTCGKKANELPHSKITRLEIIDHTTDGDGRDYTKWTKEPFKTEFQYQDDGRTLKVFLS